MQLVAGNNPSRPFPARSGNWLMRGKSTFGVIARHTSTHTRTLQYRRREVVVERIVALWIHAVHRDAFETIDGRYFGGEKDDYRNGSRYRVGSPFSILKTIRRTTRLWKICAHIFGASLTSMPEITISFWFDFAFLFLLYSKTPCSAVYKCIKMQSNLNGARNEKKGRKAPLSDNILVKAFSKDKNRFWGCDEGSDALSHYVGW